MSWEVAHPPATMLVDDGDGPVADGDCPGVIWVVAVVGVELGLGLGE